MNKSHQRESRAVVPETQEEPPQQKSLAEAPKSEDQVRLATLQKFQSSHSIKVVHKSIVQISSTLNLFDLCDMPEEKITKELT